MKSARSNLLVSYRKTIAISGLVWGIIMIGCAPETPKSEAPGYTDKQKKALNDPFGYSPTGHDPKKAEDAAKKSDRNDTLKGDWDRLWNP